MDVILANKAGEQIRCLVNPDFDAQINGSNDKDFSLAIQSAEWRDDFAFGARLFVQDTEIGGIIGEIYSDTELDRICIQGRTWRGMLSDKVIIPPTNADYATASGTANSILKSLIEPAFGGLFVVPVTNGPEISNWQFDRYCTLYDGITKMLKSVNYRLRIRYNVGSPNSHGWVDVYAVPVVDYSEELELSQDSQINFIFDDVRNGVNHLVAGGKGNLSERHVIHLYADASGNISQTQTFTGADEIVAFYENTSSDAVELEKSARDQLEKLKSHKEFTLDAEGLDIDIEVGDIVGTRDYITGLTASAPVGNIVYTISKGTLTKQYTLEG